MLGRICHWPIGWNNLIIFQQHNLNESCIWIWLDIFEWYIWLDVGWSVAGPQRVPLSTQKITPIDDFLSHRRSGTHIWSNCFFWPRHLFLLKAIRIWKQKSGRGKAGSIITGGANDDYHNPSSPPTSVCSRPALILILGIWHDICTYIWYIVNPINLYC